VAWVAWAAWAVWAAWVAWAAWEWPLLVPCMVVAASIVVTRAVLLPSQKCRWWYVAIRVESVSSRCPVGVLLVSYRVVLDVV
jgi:hypothetical protein